MIEQIDEVPSIIRAVIGLKADRYRGASPVCGIINRNVFKLRNRKDPFFSIIAEGKIISNGAGSDIQIEFRKPILQDILGVLLLRRYKYDREVIISFLKEWLKIKEDVELPHELDSQG